MFSVFTRVYSKTSVGVTTQSTREYYRIRPFLFVIASYTIQTTCLIISYSIGISGFLLEHLLGTPIFAMVKR